MDRRRIALVAGAAPVAATPAGVGQAAQVRAHASPLRVVVGADNRRPVAGEPWHFTVRATTADGRPAGARCTCRR